MNLTRSTNQNKDLNRYYQRFSDLRNSPKAKVSGLVSLTLLTVAFFGVFAIMPTFKTIAALNKEIEDAETVNVKLSKKIVSLEKAEEVFLEIQGQKDILNRVLPLEHEFERLAWQIAWIANDDGVEITNESFEGFSILEPSVVSGKENTSLPLELSIIGSYGQIKDFLTDISQVDRLLSIDEVVISSKKLRTTDEKLSANIKLTAYYSPMKEL